MNEENSIPDDVKHLNSLTGNNPSPAERRMFYEGIHYERQSKLVAPQDLGEYQKEYCALLENLKNEVNCFLWTRLPGSISMEQADAIAQDITIAISKAWDQHIPIK